MGLQIPPVGGPMRVQTGSPIGPNSALWRQSARPDPVRGTIVERTRPCRWEPSSPLGGRLRGRDAAAVGLAAFCAAPSSATGVRGRRRILKGARRTHREPPLGFLRHARRRRLDRGSHRGREGRRGQLQQLLRRAVVAGRRVRAASTGAPAPRGGRCGSLPRPRK